jgi:hypothetical protein
VREFWLRDLEPIFDQGRGDGTAIFPGAVAVNDCEGERTALEKPPNGEPAERIESLE